MKTAQIRTQVQAEQATRIAQLQQALGEAIAREVMLHDAVKAYNDDRNARELVPDGDAYNELFGLVLSHLPKA